MMKQKEETLSKPPVEIQNGGNNGATDEAEESGETKEIAKLLQLLIKIDQRQKKRASEKKSS